MKILTWGLIIFSGIAALGLLWEPYPDSGTLWGLVYAGLVITQGILILNHLKSESK